MHSVPNLCSRFPIAPMLQHNYLITFSPWRYRKEEYLPIEEGTNHITDMPKVIAWIAHKRRIPEAEVVNPYAHLSGDIRVWVPANYFTKAMGYSPSTASAWIRDGMPYKVAAGYYFVCPEEAVAWMNRTGRQLPRIR